MITTSSLYRYIAFKNATDKRSRGEPLSKGESRFLKRIGFPLSPEQVPVAAVAA